MPISIFEIIEINQKYLLERLPTFQRFCMQDIDWSFPLVGLIGGRGVGKTTMMLQRLKTCEQGVYFSCDNIDVQSFGLYTLVFSLVHDYGKRFIFIDEVHKYPNWIQEIKNCTDSFPDVPIVVSGSSGIDIQKSGYDLSRRILPYHIPTVSFREFLAYKYKVILPALTIEEIVSDYKKLSIQFAPKLKSSYLTEYCKEYSYFYRATVATKEEYYLLLENSVKKVLYEDIVRLFPMSGTNLPAIERMLVLFSVMSPSGMSYAKIAQKLSLDPKTIEYYAEILEMVGLINIVKRYDTVTNHLVKEKKFFLENVNLMEVFKRKFTTAEQVGMSREVFFVDCVKRVPDLYVSLHSTYDFYIRHKEFSMIFEVGGKGKTIKKIDEKVLIVSDDILIGDESRIPLWMFGLL